METVEWQLLLVPTTKNFPRPATTLDPTSASSVVVVTGSETKRNKDTSTQNKGKE